MRTKMLLIAVVLAGLLFSLSASATEIQSCDAIPDQPLFTPTFVYLDKFDQTLGTLKKVTVTASSCGNWSAEIDSEDPSPIDFTVIARAQVIPVLPIEGATIFEIGNGPAGNIIPLLKDDEPGQYNADWNGTDYSGIIGEEECSLPNPRVFTYTSDANLSVFKGASGEQLQISVSTSSSLQVFGSVLQQSRSSASMGFDICVVYEYETPACINGTKINYCTREGIPGWTINLKNANGAVIDTRVTDADGEYSFCGLLPGSYTVCEVKKDDWKAIEPTCIPVTLNGVDFEGVNFENEPPFCISGHKFNSVTGEGLGGWTINLKNANGDQIATTTTGADGSYKFCGLFFGSYTVCEVMKAGWTPIGPTCIPVTLDCADVPDIDFTNQPEAQKVCETAWAFLDGWECFAKTGNWGSLTEIAPGDSLTLTGDVWAGRAKCDQTKGWKVGTATITVSEDGYDLDFDLNDDCHVKDLHVWVSNVKPVVKGGFSDKRWYKSESMTGLNLDLTKPIWVAIHTETCCSACNNGCTYPAPK